MIDRETGGAIIFNKSMNRILLVRNKNHKKWGFPKGGIKNNENTYECAYREVYEETGINLYEKGNVFGKIDIKNQHYLLVHIEDFVELCINDIHEIDKIKFFSLKYLKNLKSNVGLKIFTTYYIPKYLNFIKLNDTEYNKQIIKSIL